MSQVINVKKQATLAGAASSGVIAFNAPQLFASLIVSDSADVDSAEVTNHPDPNDAGALWAEVEFTNNAAAIQGPITGFRITAGGGGVDYSLICTENV